MEHSRQALAKIAESEDYQALQNGFAILAGASCLILSPERKPLSQWSHPASPGSRADSEPEYACCLENRAAFKKAESTGETQEFICPECHCRLYLRAMRSGEALAGFGCIAFSGQAGQKTERTALVSDLFFSWMTALEEKIPDMLARSEEYRQAEKRAAQLKGRLKRLELALWGSGLALWDWNMETDEVYRSYDWGRMQGYKPGEVGHTLDAWRELIHPEDLEATIRYLEDFRKGESDHYETEFRLMRKDGGYHWVYERGRIVERAPDGRPKRSVGTLSDIDQKKRLTQELEESRRMLETLLANLPGMAYRCRFEQDWIVEFVSRGCKELTGYEPAEVVGKPVVDLEQKVHSQDRSKVSDAVMDAMQEGKPFRLSYRLVTAGGEEKWVREQGVWVRDEQGKIVALEGFVSDISGEKKAEQARLAQARLEAAMETAGAACHELNQPLQSLMARLELTAMKLEEDEPLREEFAQMVAITETMAGITSRLSRITEYRTARYLGDTQILDLGEDSE